MSFNPRSAKPDGFQVVNQGVHSGIAPNTLSRQQLAWALNVTCRGGFPTTRPGWKQLPLAFLGTNNLPDATLQSRFEDLLFQGAGALSVRNQLLMSSGGRLFAIKLGNNQVQEISITSDLNQPQLRQAWFVEANGFAVVQNSSDAPLIYDGASVRRADSYAVGGVKEVPVGTAMAYVNSRLWVASPDGRSFVAGDIAFGPSGTAPYGLADSVVKFTENDFLNTGGSFGVPLTAGRITAMTPVAQLDTSAGQGPLQVFTEQAIFSVAAPADRDTWKNLEYPIQSVSGISSGATGPAAVVSVNGDLWYRAQDGIRSFQIGRQNFNSWVNTAQSFELARVLPEDDRGLLSSASAAVFDNRLLVTVAPVRDWDHGTYHRGLAVLDFSGVSSIGSQGAPAWEGAWTGLRILQLLSGSFAGLDRCFAFVLGTGDKIELWELTRDGLDDVDEDGARTRIECRVETGSFNWQSGWDLLSLQLGESWWDSLSGTVDFTVSYRPDQDPCWQSWASWSICATAETCSGEAPVPGCSSVEPATLSAQYRRRVRFPTPADTVEVISNKPYRHGDEFQFLLTWTGTARLKKLRVWATPVPEESFGQDTDTAQSSDCAAKVCDCESPLGDYSLA